MASSACWQQPVERVEPGRTQRGAHHAAVPDRRGAPRGDQDRRQRREGEGSAEARKDGVRPRSRAPGRARRAPRSAPTPRGIRSRNPCGPGWCARGARRHRGGRTTGSGGASRAERHRPTCGSLSAPAGGGLRRGPAGPRRVTTARERSLDWTPCRLDAQLAAWLLARRRRSRRPRPSASAARRFPPLAAEAEALRRFRSFVLLALSQDERAEPRARGRCVPGSGACGAGSKPGSTRQRMRRAPTPRQLRAALAPLRERFLLALRETGAWRGARAGRPCRPAARGVGCDRPRLRRLPRDRRRDRRDRRREPGGGRAARHHARPPARRATRWPTCRPRPRDGAGGRSSTR